MVRHSLPPKSTKVASYGRSLELLPAGMSSIAASPATLTPSAKNQELDPEPPVMGTRFARVPRRLPRSCRSSSAPACPRLRSRCEVVGIEDVVGRSPHLLPVASQGLHSSGIPLLCGDVATGTLGYLAGEDNAIDEKELALRALSATQSSPLATQLCMEQEAKASCGWKEVLPRRGPRHLKSPAPTLPPRPMPSWLFGRCCRCLAYGHRAALCRDPFRCSRCLENGHHARNCRNP
jgi:hypothetical protein